MVEVKAAATKGAETCESCGGPSDLFTVETRRGHIMAGGTKSLAPSPMTKVARA